MNIVQLIRGGERTVALVDGNRLLLLNHESSASIYALAVSAIARGESLEQVVSNALGDQRVDYEAVYEGRAEWKLLPSFDHPTDTAHCMISGTGLTHKASAENRAAMHKRGDSEITDSIRMYQLGLEGGNPQPGQIGVQPEWFFKGDGSLLRGHGDSLGVESYAWDGGEEPEIAGAYLIGPDSKPYRVGMTVGNEFSDHKMEKMNYLYLAPSKIRTCSIGPELVIGKAPFEHVAGSVSISRNDVTIWNANIWSGEKNMSYSVENLEYHHFKYAAHRRPGDCHIHFFGADAFSFGDGIQLEDGDIMQVSFSGFGRPLRNVLHVQARAEEFLAVTAL